MSRTKQFDETEALDSAMHLFRRQGFSATSLSQLESVTKLNKSSIYNTFQSKENLYELQLERFRKEYTSHALAKLDHPDFHTALSDLFAALGCFESPDFPEGCIATMGALEFGGDKSALGDEITYGLNNIHKRLEARCAQAVEDEQLDKQTDCASLAAMILAVTRGVVILNKGTNAPTAGRQAFQQLLTFINLQTPHH